VGGSKVSITVDFRGLSEYHERWAKFDRALDGATKRVVTRAGMAASKESKKLMRRAGAKGRGGRHVGPAGSPANVRTGTLKRSVGYSKPVPRGRRAYEVRVGPRVKYGRWVEKGHRQRGGGWTPGYPYIEPAFTKVALVYRKIAKEQWEKALAVLTNEGK